MTTFEPGKTYRTRDGREARVYAVDGGGSYPIHGAIKHAGYWCAATWAADGGDARVGASSNDLLPPTPPAPADDAYAAAWRAGAEAMRDVAADAVTYAYPTIYAGDLVRRLPLPTAPAAPAPEPERLSGECWVNVYEGGAVECYRQRSYADNFQSSCGNPRIACIRIDLSQHRKGEGL